MNKASKWALTPVKCFLVVFFLSYACSMGWSTSLVNQKNPDQNLNKGRTEVEKGQYAAAVKTLTETIKLSPGLADAYYLRAKSLDLMGQPMRALKDIGKYIELKPQDPKGYILRGDINNFNLDHREAIESYSLALRFDSRSTNARIGRGLAYTALEKYDLAIKEYQDVIKENRLNLEALGNLGVALALSGRNEEALQKLTEALALERDLEWRSRLKKLIDEISQARSNPSRHHKSPFGKGPTKSPEKPW